MVPDLGLIGLQLALQLKQLGLVLSIRVIRVRGASPGTRADCPVPLVFESPSTLILHLFRLGNLKLKLTDLRESILVTRLKVCQLQLQPIKFLVDGRQIHWTGF